MAYFQTMLNVGIFHTRLADWGPGGSISILEKEKKNLDHEINKSIIFVNYDPPCLANLHPKRLTDMYLWCSGLLAKTKKMVMYEICFIT